MWENGDYEGAGQCALDVLYAAAEEADAETKVQLARTVKFGYIGHLLLVYFM